MTALACSRALPWRVRSSTLLGKNVAQPVAAQLCESVCLSLVDTKQPSFTSLKTTVRAALEVAFSRCRRLPGPRAHSCFRPLCSACVALCCAAQASLSRILTPSEPFELLRAINSGAPRLRAHRPLPGPRTRSRSRQLASAVSARSDAWRVVAFCVGCSVCHPGGTHTLMRTRALVLAFEV